MEKEEFYLECARLLDTVYECTPWRWPGVRKTRWNNRDPGEGRFPNFGLIRCFGDIVQVNIYHPISLCKVYKSKEEAINDIKKLTGR